VAIINGTFRRGDIVYTFVRRDQFDVWLQPEGSEGKMRLGTIDRVWGGWRGILDPALGVGQAFVGPMEDEASLAERMHEVSLNLRWQDKRGGAA
jgi:hypothetical protein